MQELPAAICEAIVLTGKTEDQPVHQVLKSGVTIHPLSGAGNHNVLSLHIEGHSYCLKQPKSSNHHEGNWELVLRREVGGMCTLIDQVPDLCPRPLS